MDAQRLWTGAGIGFGLATLAGTFWALRLNWKPQADFDILGLLWVLSNAPNLAAWAAVLALASIAVHCGVRASGYFEEQI